MHHKYEIQLNLDVLINTKLIMLFYQLLKEEMTEEETSRLSNLCMEWYFPVPTKETNKLLLLQQLLTHSVIKILTFDFFLLFVLI